MKNFSIFRQPSSNKPERDLGGMMKSLAVAQPKKVLTSPFSQTLEQIAPTWPPFDPQSQKYMALGKYVQVQGISPYTIYIAWAIRNAKVNIFDSKVSAKYTNCNVECRRVSAKVVNDIRNTIGRVEA